MLYPYLFESFMCDGNNDDLLEFDENSNLGGSLYESMVLNEKFNASSYSRSKRAKNIFKNAGGLMALSVKITADAFAKVLTNPASNANITSFKKYYQNNPNAKIIECKVDLDPANVGLCIHNFKNMANIAESYINDILKESKMNEITTDPKKAVADMYGRLTNQKYNSNLSFKDQFTSFIKYNKKKTCKPIKLKDVPLDYIIGGVSEKYFKHDDFKMIVSCFNRLSKLRDKAEKLIKSDSNSCSKQAISAINEILSAVDYSSECLAKCAELYTNWASRVVNPYFRTGEKKK